MWDECPYEYRAMWVTQIDFHESLESCSLGRVGQADSMIRLCGGESIFCHIFLLQYHCSMDCNLSATVHGDL